MAGHLVADMAACIAPERNDLSHQTPAGVTGFLRGRPGRAIMPLSLPEVSTRLVLDRAGVSGPEPGR